MLTAERQAPLDPTVERMTVGGTARQTFRYLMVVVAAGAVGWAAVDVNADESLALPLWIIPAMLAALVVAIATFFKPDWARVTGWIYAGLEGLVLGAISKAYDFFYDGVVFQAVLATIGVTVVMLWLYVTRRIRVTEKFRSVVITATLGILVAYLAGLLFRALGADIAFWAEPNPLGILITLGIVVIAALNLVLDFDFIETAAEEGIPARWQYYFAFSLMVTLVWLYLELLRLLSMLADD